MRKFAFLNLLVMMKGVLHRRTASAFTTVTTSIINRRPREAPAAASLLFRRYHPSQNRLKRWESWSDNSNNDGVDDWGNSGADQRIMRKGRGDPDRQSSNAPSQNTRQWRRNDNSRDDGQWGDNRPRRQPRNNDRGDWRRDGDRDDRRGNRSQPRRNNNNSRDRWSPNSGNDRSQKRRGGKPDDTGSKIDMKALEAEGFVHLYGLAPILSALKSNKRDFSPREQLDDLVSARFPSDGDDDDDDFASESPIKKEETKPEAQFTPWLFLQDRAVGAGSGRTGDKVAAATELKQLAEDLGIPVAYTDKGSLNALSGNRPHQGFVLRCGPLEFESLSRVPYPDGSDPSTPNLWLVLDEVVDPQNLGALLRSSFFLGGNSNRMGLLVCSKNSAPPSPVVSAASAGALELLDVYSTSSLPRTLASAREDGFRIIGAASSKPRIENEDDVQLYDLQDLPLSDNNQPTLLVLGSEGHGLRTLVAKLCTEFVPIPRGDPLGPNDAGDDDEDEGKDMNAVDSLNVSVTGGILLWHLLYGGGAPKA